MRNGLYMFRHAHRLSQREIAEKIGCARATYSAIECGTRSCKMAFWSNLQKAFDIPDADIGGLMKNDEDTPKNDGALD